MASTNLSVFAFNDKQIRFESRDGQIWVSLTDMARATGKRINHWLDQKSTQEFLTALNESVVNNSDAGIPASAQPQGFEAVLDVNKGGTPQKQGTWAVDEVAIDFAQWCNVKFRIWVNRTIKEILSGQFQSVPKTQLTSAEKMAIATQFIGTLKEIGYELDNPRFAQSIRDLVGDAVGLGQSALPGTQDVWLGVAEKAEQMGYPVALATKYRGSLGAWVSKHIEELGLEWKREKRLCNGTERFINIYRDTDALEEIIREYMDVKAIAN